MTLSALAVASCATPKDSGSELPDAGFAQAAGGSTEISPEGGEVTVREFPGFGIVVPEGAYAETTVFDISLSDISDLDLGADIHPVSPLISVHNGGEYSEEFLEVTVPISIGEDEFALGFFLDEETHALEAMPIVELASDHIVVATRHFSSFFISSIPYEELLDADVDTGFLPGRDDFEFPNYGSVIAPEGHCAGQSISAMWYFLEMRAKGAPALYGAMDEQDELWSDNRRGYRLSSAVQSVIDWDGTLRKIALGLSRASPVVAWAAFTYAMKATQEPQYVSVYGSLGGHALVGYRVAGNKLFVSDPNFPGDTQRYIELSGAAFVPYTSGFQANGQPVAFPSIGFVAKTALIKWPLIGERFLDPTYSADLFPSYSLTIESEVGIASSLTADVQSRVLKPSFSVAGMDDAALLIFRGNSLVAFAGNPVSLEAGTNTLGFFVARQKGSELQFVDFQWIPISYHPPAIDELDPSEANAGDVIAIRGTSFGAVPGTVTLSGVELTVSSWSDTVIQAALPESATSGDIVVHRGGDDSESAALAIVEDSLLPWLHNFTTATLDLRAAGTYSITQHYDGQSSVGPILLSAQFGAANILWSGTHFTAGATSTGHWQAGDSYQYQLEGTVSDDGTRIESLRLTDLWEWNPTTDYFVSGSNSVLLRSVPNATATPSLVTYQGEGASAVEMFSAWNMQDNNTTYDASFSLGEANEFVPSNLVSAWFY